MHQEITQEGRRGNIKNAHYISLIVNHNTSVMTYVNLEKMQEMASWCF